MNELSDFTRKWCLDEYPPEPVAREHLDAAERHLNVHFPMDYRFQVLSAGLPNPTLALLSAIAELNLDLQDLSNLYQPEMIISETQGWRKIGMPVFLIPIGGDSLGNLFCFDERELRNGRVAQAAVYHWDHELGHTKKVAASFASWIAIYLGDWSIGINATDF